VSRKQYPASIRVTSWLVVAMVVLSAVTVLLTWLRYDDIVLAWAERNAAAGRILAQDGLEALKQSDRVPAFIPLAIVSLAVFAPLVWVLLLFLRDGVIWSRPALTASVLVAALIAIQGIGRDLPVEFLVLSVVSLAVQLALLVSIWSRGNSAWVHEAEPLPQELDATIEH
jgi:hypothetical protein